jgi:hypothetical protein
MGCHFGRPYKFLPPPIWWASIWATNCGSHFFSFPSTLRSPYPDPAAAGCARSRRHPPAYGPPPPARLRSASSSPAPAPTRLPRPSQPRRHCHPAVWSLARTRGRGRQGHEEHLLAAEEQSASVTSRNPPARQPVKKDDAGSETSAGPAQWIAHSETTEATARPRPGSTKRCQQRRR